MSIFQKPDIPIYIPFDRLWTFIIGNFCLSLKKIHLIITLKSKKLCHFSGVVAPHVEDISVVVTALDAVGGVCVFTLISIIID